MRLGIDPSGEIVPAAGGETEFTLSAFSTDDPTGLTLQLKALVNDERFEQWLNKRIQMIRYLYSPIKERLDTLSRLSINQHERRVAAIWYIYQSLQNPN